MRKVSGLLLTLILLSASAGCLAEEIQEELEKVEVDDKRYTFALPTLGCLLYTSPSPRDPE